MRIIIIGAGKIGLNLAGYLSQEDNDVTLIDTNPDTIAEAVNAYDINGITGNGVNYTTQEEAGMRHADVVIATTYSDEINMLCCLVAKKVGVKRAVARIRDPEYSRQFLYLLDEMGLDMVVNPELESAREIYRLLRYPAAIGIDTFAKGRVDLAEMIISENSPLAGLQIKDIPKKLAVRILVCAVQHGEEVYIPKGDHTLYAGDRIHFTASHDHLFSFFKKVDHHEKLKNILIVGGGRIGYYLARLCIDAGMSVKIIEKNRQNASELTEMVPKARVILGDGTDLALLEEENFENADACVAVTGIDEENIILSLYARQQKTPKIITKISKTSLIDMLQSVGLSSIVAPKTVTANLILSYVRAMQSGEESNVQTLYKLVDDRVEAVEFYVSKKSDVTGIPLKDLQLKKDVLICTIIRNNSIVFPGGNDMILPGDNVIITTTQEKLSDLDDILN
ncbi:MAG: Trk system potassium transporter TrkA [Clostridia bacterium]|nr:Trk system potassium transporter TrkA [Clostridia bacterium]MBQ4624666.1 Trk system potassium transporter TrkA [Clostridia bacterium]